MDGYTGRLLADRYRLPRSPSEEFELVESRAYDTASGQVVLVRQVPLPEVVEAETLDAAGRPRPGGLRAYSERATRTPEDPVVRRAVAAAAAAARLPDHPRLDQVFDVFVQGDGLWIVSELLIARPLAAVLAEERLKPYRAAEVAADLLAALRIVHAHGWTHRNLTARTVMICEDGRAVLTGLAAGAAEEVLCGYDPLPTGPRDDFASARREQALPSPAPAAADDPARGAGSGLPTPQPRQALPGQRAPQGQAAPPADAGRQVPQPGAPVQGWPEGWTREPAQPGQFPQSAPPGQAAGPQPPGQYGPWQQAQPVPQSEQGRYGPPPGYQSGPQARPEGQADRGGVPGEQEAPGAADVGGEGGAAGLVERLRQQGSQPPEPEAPGRPPQGELPSSWDFEGGRSPMSAAERAARSAALAAYRAGTQAGANAAGRSTARNGTDGQQGEPPGPPRPGQPVRTGWEPVPLHSRRPQQPEPQQPPQLPPYQLPPSQQPPRQGPPPQQAAPVPAPVPGPRAGAPAAPPVSRPHRYRGPDTALAAERARQARIMTVGAVTERWPPELAGPVYEHWRLAPPVGPAADFWALGALLFRVVQGHPAYPEDNAAELTQAVCAEQPAFAEDCGALRPIVESLLRQDPTERPSAEELRGWLRSLLRSAPEPEVGRKTVTAPPPALEPGRPADPRRLPIVRRRGPLVGPLRRRAHRTQRGPRRLGVLMVTLVLLGLIGAVAFVMLFLSGGQQEGAAPPPQPAAPTGEATGGQDGPPPAPTGFPEETGAEAGGQGGAGDPPSGSSEPSQEEEQPAAPPEGYESREDPAGFSLTVPEGWQREETGDSQVAYSDGQVDILVVPGRDTTARYGQDPMRYQLQRQPELTAFRDDQYGSSSDLYETRVGDSVVMAEGVFRWEQGGQRVAYNMVVLLDGAYHVVMVNGPASEEDRIADVYDVTAESYQVTG